MSSILVDNLTGKTTAGNVTVTSEGGAVTMHMQQGLAKAWINMDGTGTIGANDSFNMSTVTDNGTGNYTLAIGNSMVNALYSYTFGDYKANNNSIQLSVNAGTAPTTSTIRIQCVTTGNNVNDPDQANITIHGDLA